MTRDKAFETPKVRGPTSRHDRTLFDWVGGPDGATNGDMYKPKLKLRDDYPIEYSCEDVMEGRAESISEVWFLYDYELTLDGEQDPVEARRAFEWSVLWNVGVKLGLYNCSIDMQDSSPNGRRRLLQEEDAEERLLEVMEEPTLIPSFTRVIALGNDAEDQIDVQAGKCVCLLKHRSCVQQVLTVSFALLHLQQMSASRMMMDVAQ